LAKRVVYYDFFFVKEKYIWDFFSLCIETWSRW